MATLTHGSPPTHRRATPVIGPNTPADGHTFEISIRSRGSIGRRGDADYWSEWRAVQVRAWNQRDALHRAAQAPLVAWYPEDEED